MVQLVQALLYFLSIPASPPSARGREICGPLDHLDHLDQKPPQPALFLVLKALPHRLVGEDGKIYGPFQGGELTALPEHKQGPPGSSA